MIQNPQYYTNLGPRCLPKGFLFVGPPGTGKSLISEAIAGSAQSIFYKLAMSDFNTKWVGEGAKKIKELFAEARRIALQEKKIVIIFLDELDAAGDRDQERTGSVDQTTIQLLCEMAEPNENVIAIETKTASKSVLVNFLLIIFFVIVEKIYKFSFRLKSNYYFVKFCLI